MLARVLFSALFVSASWVAAAPARTHCRCTIVDDSNTTVSPSSPTPTTPTTSSAASFDVCSDLGPELENFRHSEPELYESYLDQAKVADAPTATDEEVPLTTTVLLNAAAKNSFENLGIVLPRPTGRPQPRIVCRSEPEPFSAYQDSRVTLLALQVIIGMAVLACIAESVTLAADWFCSKDQVQQKPVLRLVGPEQRLRAFIAESVFSPGADKKQRVYDSANWTPRAWSEKREFDAFEEEDDDEMNRPVM